jgi:predicted RNA-binding Zn ribbon-like protein
MNDQSTCFAGHFGSKLPSVQWYGDVEAKPAPGPLRRVQAFINTLDRESGQDRLADPADAAEWLIAAGLLDNGAVPGRADLADLAEVRESLRALVIHNTGGPAPTTVQLDPLRRLAAGAPARLIVGDAGAVEVAPVGGSVPDRLLGLLLIVADAQRDGSWVHLKSCANEDCRWAFYDRSRNHGGTWCDMASCGNKLKNREFRARRRSR